MKASKQNIIVGIYEIASDVQTAARI